MKLCVVMNDQELQLAVKKEIQNAETVVVITMVNMNLTEEVLKW